MRTLVLALSSLIIGASAYANIEVSCIDGDCMTHGWEIFDQWKRESSYIICNSGDCAKIGWTGELKGLPSTETRCKASDCFGKGWLIYDVFSGSLASEVTCRADVRGVTDCLTQGWDIRDVNGRYQQTVLCANGDCRHVGWDLFVPGYPRQATRCKLGGCFQTGWVHYR